MSDFDKFKSCKDCPDRSISPSCHSICDGYKFRKEKQAEINRNRRARAYIPTTHHERAKIDSAKRQKKRYQWKRG